MRVDQIVHTARNPAQAIVAALVADALDCARHGDTEAARWLELASPRWLPALTPPDVDCDALHRRMLALLPEPRGSPAPEDGSWTQLELEAIWER